MKTVRKQKRSVLLFIFLIVVVGVITVGCVVNYAQTASNRHKVEEISQQIEEMKSQNEELEHYLEEEHNDEYVEKKAREEFGYAKPGERVFYDSSFSNKK